MEKIKIEATIEKPTNQVWEYYTNPAHIINWNFADPSWHCPSAVNDMKVGGTYKARMEARDGSFGFDLEMIYSDIIDGKSFTYGIPDDRQVSVLFTNMGESTVINILFDPETENPIEMQKAGWMSILNNFKQYAEML